MSTEITHLSPWEYFLEDVAQEWLRQNCNLLFGGMVIHLHLQSKDINDIVLAAIHHKHA